jgi:hypothetical protein
MTDLTSFFKTDLVDDHVDDDVNKSIAAGLRAEYANTETITATKELSDNDCQFQFITASGANRTVELAPEATGNHPTVIYNSGASNNVIVKDDSGTYTFATLAPDEWMMFLSLNAEGWVAMAGLPLTMASFAKANHNHADAAGGGAALQSPYKLSVTVVSNNITVAIQHPDGTNPSASRPLYFMIGSTVRPITDALSVTKNAGTQWFGLGTNFADLEQDFFSYLVWNTGPATDIMDIAFGRISHGRVYSDFSATTTDEKYLAYGNGTAPASTDSCIVIGRFAATLGAAASYNWSVPTFTNANLIMSGIYETRWLDWIPTYTGFSANPTTLAHKYRLNSNNCTIIEREFTPGTSNATTFTISLPFTAKTVTNMVWQATGTVRDNGVDLSPPGRASVSSAGTVMNVFRDYISGGWTASSTKALYQMTPLTYEI